MGSRSNQRAYFFRWRVNKLQMRERTALHFFALESGKHFSGNALSPGLASARTFCPNPQDAVDSRLNPTRSRATRCLLCFEFVEPILHVARCAEEAQAGLGQVERGVQSVLILLAFVDAG